MSFQPMFVPLPLRSAVDNLIKKRMISAIGEPSMVGSSVRKWMYRLTDIGQSKMVLKLALANYEDIKFA